MHTDVLFEVLGLLLAAVIAVALFRRFRLPAILAYLVTGVALGPYGFGVIPENENTSLLAEFGVVFLMFTVGLEFSLPQMIAMRREVLLLGGSQVVGTTLVVMLLLWAFGLTLEGAFVIAGAIAMSSTAIVIKQLAEQLELNSRHGRLSVGILLFQDLAVVPFLVIIPTLAAGNDGGLGAELAWALVKGFIASAGMLAAGHWLLRPLFREVAQSHSAELFTLTVLLFSLAAAWLTNLSGLSLALGAFLAGMMLAETEYRHQVEADIRPFRDVLLGLFFVTVGMMLDTRAVWEYLPWVIAGVVGIVTVKLLLTMLMCVMLKVENGVALRTAAALAQGGEFGLALLSLGLRDSLLPEPVFQVALAAMIISMAFGPTLIRYNGAIAKRIFARSYGQDRQHIRDEIATGAEELSGHIIICGFGRIGQNVARFLEQEKFDYVALDLDPIRVQEARAAGVRVFYGDTTHKDILEAAGFHRARIVVISLDDPHAALKMLVQIRTMRQDIPILVRTRDDAYLDKLQQAGATEVVPETLEASLTLVAHLLFLLHVPVERITSNVQSVRNDRYQMLRQFFPGEHVPPSSDAQHHREVLHAVGLPEGAYAVGHTPAELSLDKLDVIITAVRRDDERPTRPRSDMMLKAGDVVVLYGTPENLEHAESVLLKG